MQTKTKSKIAIAISILMVLSIAASMALVQGQVVPSPGTVIPTYAHMNVFPTVVGIGQQITLGIFLATPMETSQYAHNFTVNVVPPSGNNITLGPYTSDTTGGTVAYYTPDQVGNYTFQFFYPGEYLNASGGPNTGYYRLINAASNSLPVTVTVQQEAVNQGSVFPFTPLPTQWWQTPVSAENSQNWWAITGAWYGLASTTFASTGAYNCSGLYNPYTEDVLSGHVLWSTPWNTGGVAGGYFGGGEDMGHFWSTYQYTPRYAPVIMNGVVYSTWYTFGMSTSALQGIRALDLYTGKQLWVINTTTTLRCGMQYYQYTINDYGVRGPWLWTTGTLPASDTGGSVPSNSTGTQWNLYDAQTGKYCMSVVNGTGLTFNVDAKGELIGYFLNTTAGTQIIHPTANTNVISTTTGPHLTAVNMTVCAGFTSGMSPQNTAVNTFRAMNTGYFMDVNAPNNVSGVTISPALALSSITGDTIVYTGGFVHGQGVGGETAGWLVMATQDAYTGQILSCQNLTYASGDGSFLPYTRTTQDYTNGLFINANDISYIMTAYNVKDGSKAWTTTLTGDNGAEPNVYDQFSLKNYNCLNGCIWVGLGGDIWCINNNDGSLRWYTNTTKLVGSSGLETPYNVWPIWVFSSSCVSNNVAYLTVGHEYNPPLFRGARVIAVNVTDGSLVWDELDTSVTATSIAYGKLLSLNAYDNQLYCFGRGPSKVTVQAPAVGVTTSTPITITGTITDVSPGASQQQTFSNYPNGLPCVSDASQSNFMESVYQQQVMPNNITGVPITISVIDSNGNLRDVGTTTSNAMGTYGFTWTPDITGNYQVIATFKGTNSYYPSSASTYFFTGETPTHAPTATPQTNLATTSDLMTYIVGVGIAIIIAVAIVGLLILRKK